MIYRLTDEDKAKQLARRTLRKAQGIDLLAERERKIKYWKDRAKTNSGYAPHNGAWWHVFTWSNSFRRLLMPKLRARLDARDRAARQQYAAELRAHSAACEARKAARAEEKKAAKRASTPETPTTMDLFA